MRFKSHLTSIFRQSFDSENVIGATGADKETIVERSTLIDSFAFTACICTKD